MKCPKCGLDNNKVTKTQDVRAFVKRTRKCLTCGKTFTTTESILKIKES